MLLYVKESIFLLEYFSKAQGLFKEKLLFEVSFNGIVNSLWCSDLNTF